MSATTTTMSEPDTHQHGKVQRIMAKICGHHNSPTSSPLAKRSYLRLHKTRRPSEQEIAAQISLEIWSAAYDAFKADSRSAGLVRAYESIIVQELQRDGVQEIPGERRLEMMEAIAASRLEKTLSERASGGDEPAKDILVYARETIESFRNVYPSAAIAWSGFCVLTPLLLDPLLQQQDLKEALIYVTSNITHFMSLYAILLRENWTSESDFENLRLHTRQTLLDLYRRILEFEMNMVCAAASSWNFAAKNVVDWSGWSKMAGKIRDADEELRGCIERFGTEDLRERVSCEGEREGVDEVA